MRYEQSAQRFSNSVTAVSSCGASPSPFRSHKSTFPKPSSRIGAYPEDMMMGVFRLIVLISVGHIQAIQLIPALERPLPSFPKAKQGR
jgi:hypothetical protein